MNCELSRLFEENLIGNSFKIRKSNKLSVISNGGTIIFIEKDDMNFYKTRCFIGIGEGEIKHKITIKEYKSLVKLYEKREIV